MKSSAETSDHNNTTGNPFDANQNPGLEPYELTDYHGVDGENFYELAYNIKRYLKRVIPDSEWAAVNDHLTSLGGLCGGRLNELAIASHKEGKYGTLEKFDRHGNRVDDINYCEEQREIRRLAFEAGVANLDQHPDWTQPFQYEHREVCAYLLNLNGEMGVTCPLAMTEGMIEVLREIGTDEQKKKWLPLITHPDSTSHFMVGQYLTERVGGSNISANRTVARPVDPEDKTAGSKWLLHGEKWFCSNPGDIWVTTAKVEGTDTIAAFLVGRFKDNGELNGHNILRLKDIIGSRGKVTAEVEYNNVEAELLGRVSVGLAYLIRHVISVSRIHTSLGAIAGARRSYWEARAYASRRRAYGQAIEQFDSTRRVLAAMQVELTALELCICHNWTWRREGKKLTDLMAPLMKLVGTRYSERIGHEAIILHGGNGILGDYSVLPRLRNDAIINETWEGAHQLLAGHAAKSFGRRAIRKELFEFIDSAVQAADKCCAEHGELAAPLEELSNRRSMLEKIDVVKMPEANRQGLADEIFSMFGLAMLLQEAALSDGVERETFTAMANMYLEILKYGHRGLLPEAAWLLDEKHTRQVIAFS